MTSHEELPDDIGAAFPVRLARAYGVSRARLRRRDLDAPFYGVRIRADAATPPIVDEADPYARQRRMRVVRARAYDPGRHHGHFFSHSTAASIWGAPLPLEFAPDGRVAEASDLALHVSASGAVAFPRASGIVGHRTLASMTEVGEHDGLRVTSPAATWVSMGALSVSDLVALGDYFCRAWRPGIGRRHIGRPSLTTVEDIRMLMNKGRRRGAERLRAALDLIREDSWSPRESQVRCILLAAGLPEPDLNIDVFDDRGVFLGCVDMAYPEHRVAVEYLGIVHDTQWARDVERIAALRAAGWTVIEVTSVLLRRPEVLVNRVRAALR
jgi:hypothetical protein